MKIVYHTGMSRQELGNGVWYDPEAKGYIMLDVTGSVATQHPRTIDDTILLPKSEYHCSLAAVRKLANEDREVEAKLVDDVKRYLGNNAVEFAGMTGDYYFCQKTNDAGEIESTVIGGVTIIGLDGLRALLREKIPEYQPPFPHVTLLKSANSKFGIGVNSQEDLRTYCRKLEEYGL